MPERERERVNRRLCVCTRWSSSGSSAQKEEVRQKQLVCERDARVNSWSGSFVLAVLAQKSQWREGKVCPGKVCPWRSHQIHLHFIFIFMVSKFSLVLTSFSCVRCHVNSSLLHTCLRFCHHSIASPLFNTTTCNSAASLARPARPTVPHVSSANA
jgi:hypothetical protein